MHDRKNAVIGALPRRSRDWLTAALVLCACGLGGYALFERIGSSHGFGGAARADAAFAKVNLDRFWRAAQTGNRIGPAHATITIVVFSNYGCGFCRRFEPTLRQLRARYPDQVAVIFKHYTPVLTRRASAIDLAADCASDQAKFPEYNHVVFADTLTAADPDRWLTLGQRIGVDTTIFARCVRSQRYASRIRRDTDEGHALGVGGTPTSFVNGIRIVGQVPFETLDSVVSSQLRERSATPN